MEKADPLAVWQPTRRVGVAGAFSTLGFLLFGTVGSPFGFTGEMRDPNGLNYHRARYYDPGMGIWTAIDPFEGVVDQGRPLLL